MLGTFFTKKEIGYCLGSRSSEGLRRSLLNAKLLASLTEQNKIKIKKKILYIRLLLMVLQGAKISYFCPAVGSVGWFIAPENYPSKGSCARGLFSGAMNFDDPFCPAVGSVGWFIAPENYPSKGSCARGLFSGAMNLGRSESLFFFFFF